MLELKNASITIIVSNDRYIRKINREFRGHDEPTDVISFSNRENPFPSVADTCEEIGDGVGGDLAIRSASTSKDVRAVVAVSPILIEPSVGLGLMRELTFPQAVRWARDRFRAELVKWLEAGTYAARVPPRPGLVLYGSEDLLADRTPLLSSDPGLELRTLPGLGHRYLAGHPAVMTIINDWLKEHL